MPNTGQPSRDCLPCRQRRVKCDLVRPGCGQCRRKGISCPGYRDELDQRFRTESISSLVSKTGQDRRNTRKRALDSERGEAASHPQPLLAGSWNDHFMSLVMENFSSASAHCKCHSAIPALLSGVKRDSTVHKACDAVGRVYIANRTNLPDAKIQQARAYGRAISAINKDLQHPQQWEGNETLVSVVLLCISELLSSAEFISGPVSPAWCIHTRGMVALLNHRQRTGFSTPEDRSIFLSAFNLVQNQALMTRQDHSGEFLSWIHKLYEDHSVAESRILRSTIFTHHCTQLCVAIQKLIDAGDRDSLLAIYPSILHQVGNVENEIAPLSHDEAVRNYVIEPPRAALILPGSATPPGLRSYEGTFRLELSTQVYALLSLASNAPSCKPEQYAHILEAQRLCVEEFQALADHVLSMLASMLRYDASGSGGVCLLYTIGLWDVFRVMWPLRLIVSSPISSDREREMASSMLKMVQLGSRM
ncbi:hypothetical protein BJX76DRAFT_367107 [Aspergillus varians]